MFLKVLYYREQKLTSAVDIDNIKNDLRHESALMTAAHVLVRLTKEGKSYQIAMEIITIWIGICLYV
jgi:adenylosuccinate lyase